MNSRTSGPPVLEERSLKLARLFVCVLVPAEADGNTRELGGFLRFQVELYAGQDKMLFESCNRAKQPMA